MNGKTIKDRRTIWTQLSKNLELWLKMTDAELLAEAKKGFPNISEASRNECIKMLVMDHTEQMVGDGLVRKS